MKERKMLMKQHKYPLATDLQNTPPVPCEFKVGDVVTFTNDYGVKFHDKVVTGFAPSVENGRFVYFDSDAWWFPVNPSQLSRAVAESIPNALPDAKRKLQKMLPIVSKPDNFDAFNGRESAPYRIARSEAAAGLRLMRAAARRGNGRITQHSRGVYTLVGHNTLVLSTR
jgi:hypothetical protein